MALDRHASRAIQFFLAWAMIWVSSGLLVLAGLVQHMMTCFKHEAVGLFVIGLVLPPIGVAHGWGIWLGLFPN